MPVKTSEEAKRLIKEWMVSRGLPAKEVDQKTRYSKSRAKRRQI